MEIKDDVTQEEMTEFFLNDPKLCFQGLADLDLVKLHQNGKYEPRENTKYSGIYDDNGEMIGLLCVEVFTQLALTVHFYIPTKLQCKGLALEVQKYLYNYFLDTYPWAIKVVTPVPSACTHVQRSAERFGMKLEGTITKCMKWRDELVDLLMYGLELKRK